MCASTGDVAELLDAPSVMYARRISSDAANKPATIAFVECDPSLAVETCDPDAFFDRSYDDQLKKMVTYVVEHEGPVLDRVLARRIARAHGWQRTGSRIQDRVNEVARSSFKSTEESVGTFYWPSGMTPDDDVPFRFASADARRSVDEVCLDELAALAAAIVSSTASDDENLVAMAREFGLLQLRAASRGRLEQALGRYRAGLKSAG